MFLCRHLLLRVNIPRPPPFSLLAQRPLSNTANCSQDAHDDSNAAIDLPPLSHSNVSGASESSPQDLKTAKAQLPLRKMLPAGSEAILPRRRFSPRGFPLGKLGATGVGDIGRDGSLKKINAYEARRTRDIATVRGISVEQFIILAQAASQAGLSAVMDHIATDVVEAFQGSEHERAQIIFSLVALTAERPLLSDDRLHMLLTLLESLSPTTEFSNQTVIRLVKSALTRLTDDPAADRSVAILLKLLKKYLRIFAPTGAGVVTYRPPDIVQLSYNLVQKLLHIQRDQQALDVFQILVDSNNIPPEAISEASSTSTDISFIILSTLVRSCLHWGWRRGAVELCKAMLRAEMVPNPLVIDLTLDVLYSLLEMPTSVDLGQFSYLIRELDTRAADFRIPDGLFRLFYDSAYQQDEGKLAEIVYEHTQTPSIIEQYQYPSPQGRTLTWLLRHLTVTSCNIHLGRCLTKHVVDSYEPIPPQDRAPFIAIAASHGYIRYARALWERYSVGRDRDAVVGNAATMLRIVSLFAYATRKAQSLLESAKENKGLVVGQSESELYESRSKENAAFAHHVVAEFRRINEPLGKAGHFHLTSLARAYFMLGEVSAGFEAFRALLERKEIPDLHDINVALSAMAEYTPRGAARMVERMIQKGVQPDPITFGTVIHFAAIHRDTELVSALISRARQLDNVQLSLKSVQALIRASLAMEDTSQSTLKANLTRALEIMRSLAHSNFICSPNTGNYCVASALRVDDPIMAFNFWSLLVHRKVEWGDAGHRILRHRIAARIRKHSRAGWLVAEQEKIMLHKLAHEPKIIATK